MVTIFRFGVWFGRNWTQTFFSCVTLTGNEDLKPDGFVIDENDDRLNDASKLRLYHHKRFQIHGNPKPISRPTAHSAQSPSPMTIIEKDTEEVVFERSFLIDRFSSNNKKIETKQVNENDAVLVKKMKIFPNKILPQSLASVPSSVPDYVQIREADSPGVGDFNCGGTEVKGSCAFYVDGIEHAKKICNSFSDYCRGFVLTPQLAANSLPLLLDSTPGRQLVYLKTKVNKMTMNFLTEFFVKTKHMKEIGWKFQ